MESMLRVKDKRESTTSRKAVESSELDQIEHSRATDREIRRSNEYRERLTSEEENIFGAACAKEPDFPMDRTRVSKSGAERSSSQERYRGRKRKRWFFSELEMRKSF